MTEEIRDYVIRLWERAEKASPLVVEEFRGTRQQAERRLSEVWNDTPCAVLSYDSRYRAALLEKGGRRHVSQIC